MDLNQGQRREWDERAPDGAHYRVVLAPRGESLRGGSAATDLTTAVLDLVVSAVVAVGRNDGTWKVGVLRRGRGVERFVHKSKGLSLHAAQETADRARESIRTGALAWS